MPKKVYVRHADDEPDKDQLSVFDVIQRVKLIYRVHEKADKEQAKNTAVAAEEPNINVMNAGVISK